MFNKSTLHYGLGFAILALVLPRILTTQFLQHQPETEPAAYTVHILSFDPLMIYLENFVSKTEREHLLSIGSSIFNRSAVLKPDGELEVSDYRTSSTAFLPDGDQIVERIISRASEFQGFTRRGDHESLQLTRYSMGQKFDAHWDHQQNDSPSDSKQRLTTIFTVLEASCEECGTRFPSLSIDWAQEDGRWCRFLDCEDKEGITVRPIPGNALFWKNLNSSYLGDWRTLHAGLPPEKGVKTGLNIWTYE